MSTLIAPDCAESAWRNRKTYGVCLCRQMIGAKTLLNDYEPVVALPKTASVPSAHPDTSVTNSEQLNIDSPGKCASGIIKVD